MPKRSAGLIMYRNREMLDRLEVFLVHPGGPFWAKKDLGAWSIPKGEYTPAELPLDAAIREFREETGFLPRPPFHELGSIQQASGKIVTAWGFAGDCDPADLVSNLSRMQWPPRSGQICEFPEVDRGAWFSLASAREHILQSQQPLLDALCRVLHLDPEGSPIPHD